MLKKTRKIVLAPPYSGTMYAYFRNCITSRKDLHLEILGHPYYKNLYGMYTEQTKDLAVTLSILYDEVIIPPADAHIPSKDLGFNIDWNDFKKFLKKNEEIIKYFSIDPELSALLKDKDDSNKMILLRELSYCIHLSKTLNCPIFCGEGTKRIIDRLSAINHIGPVETALCETNFLNKYLTLTGFVFKAEDLDIFEKIKNDSSVRKYCNKFINILESNADEITTEESMKRLLKESIYNDSINKNIKGGFSVASKVFGVAGLMPTIGTAFSVVSCGLDLSSNIISQINYDWYELASKITIISDFEQLKKKIEEDTIY